MKISSYLYGMVIFSITFFISCNALKSSNSKRTAVPVSDHISDLMLIYHGGGHRPEWNPNELKHYVFRENNGQVEWLFDGFLFLEIRAELNNKAYDFGVAKPSTLKPTKSEWEWLINKTFAANYGPAAIEHLLDSLDKSGNPAPFKRKIVLGIPNPIEGTENWGSVNNTSLDFAKNEDRVTAAKWYIDETIKKFKKQNYKYLELEGFYWINEAIVRDFDVIQKVNEYVHQKNLTSCWIPYNYAPGAEKWKSAGFDIAYQQPNYFFKSDRPLSIMTRALSFAKENGMAMEVEFDGKVHLPEYLPRFYTYLQMYDKYKVWDSPSVAYYEGGGTWLNMARSVDASTIRAFNDLSDIIVKRQNKVAKSFKKVKQEQFR